MASMQIEGLPDRFTVECEIGRGGMAVVYRAHDGHLDRFVAIKVLSPEFSHAFGVERFSREVAVTAKLVHPGIVALFDSGVAAGHLYYVMPLVPGESLRARLQRERRLTLEEATSFAADIAEALAFAHGSGVVHRDVKPENIFSVGGRAVLADFGIAHLAADNAPDAATQEGARQLTTLGQMVGTIAYMSPEQVTGSPVDGRSDLYSLGCVLYELLAGAPPFTGSVTAVIGQHLSAMPQALSERGVRVSARVDELIMRLLAKDKAARPASAGEVSRLLRANDPVNESTRRDSRESDIDRLVAEGIRSFRFGTTGGPAGRSHLDQAEVYFKRALEQAPRDARALSALGNWYFVMGNFGYRPREEAFSSGRELFLAALAADDQCGDVHASLTKLALYYDDDCHAALRHAERAVALSPKDSECWRTLSIVSKIQGRLDAAVDQARTAVSLGPEVPSLNNLLGDTLLASGRNAEAVDALRRTISLQPGYGPALERMELAHVRLGEFELALDYRAGRLRAAGERERADALLKDAEVLGAVEARRRDLAHDVERLLQQAERGDPFAEYYTSKATGDRIIAAYAELGDWSNAMTWLQRAYEHRPARLRRLLTDMTFDRRGLAADPRYARLLRVAGLEDLL